MTDQLHDPLTDVVGRFVAAESALEALRLRQTELREASALLLDATSDMDETTRTSMTALDEVRADLRRRFDDEMDRLQRQEGIDTEVARVLAEMHLVLEQLRAIDPAQIAKDLSEIRRDGTENASELREIRRLTDSVERTQGQISRDVEARSTALDATITDLGSTVDGRLGEIDRGMAALARTSRVTIGLVIAVLVAATVGIFV